MDGWIIIHQLCYSRRNNQDDLKSFCANFFISFYDRAPTYVLIITILLTLYSVLPI